MRINKYIASCGICSRRKAEEYINNSRVTINGEIAALQSKVEDDDVVCLDGKIIKLEKQNVTIAYNKPVGIVCTSEKNEKNSIISAINYPVRLFNIGRLDKDSQGLILLTNDGDLCYKLTKASEEHEKEYEVIVDKPLQTDFEKRMSSGIKILDKVTAPCKVKKISEKKFRIILIQGLNRQIRRMCEALGYEVVKLTRLRIDKLSLGNIKQGEYRELSEKQVKAMFYK